MALPITLRTLVCAFPVPASGWWVFPHTGGDGFPSLALRIPASGFQRVKLKVGTSEAASLRPSAAPARWGSAFRWVPQRTPTLPPSDRSFAFVKASRYLEPEKQLNQVFHLFWVRWLTYSHFQGRAAWGALCIPTWAQGLLGNALWSSRGPRRPTQKPLHRGGCYCTSPDEVHKDFMPQTALFVRD